MLLLLLLRLGRTQLPLTAMLCALSAVSLPVTAEPLSIPMKSAWFLRSAQDLAATGAQLSQVDYIPVGWMQAVVPGTVLESYVKAGKYPEPYYDHNSKISKGLIPDASVPNSVFTHPRWYYTTFTLDASYRRKTL